jgi:hypothetical protein
VSFLCTVDDELVTGYPDGHARMLVFEGLEFYDWPEPWGFECDDCGRRFPYGAVCGRVNAKLVPPAMRQVGGDRHRCAFCEGYVEPPEQPEQLDLLATASRARAPEAVPTRKGMGSCVV